MSLRWCESPAAARIAALSADQAPTAIIRCPHMTEQSSITGSALGGVIGVFLAAVTAVPGGGSPLCPSGWICPARPIMSPSMKIGTWYELYWQTPDSTWPGQHWALWTRYKPVGGYYGSGDPTVVRSQFAQIKAAGIDYVLLDHTNGIWNDNGEIEKNAKSIFDTDDQLPTDQRMPLAFVLGTWGYSTAAELQAEADHVWSTYASRPSYLLWKGKPLLVDYGAYDTTFVPDVVRSWTDPHFTLRHAVEIANSSNPLLQQFVPEGLWGWYLPEPQLVSPETIAVAPGYDRQHAASPAPASIDRENGTHYTREWLFAIKHNPENIILPSWNDFAEETQIEPSINVSATPWVDYYGTETPDWYVQITSNYTHLRTGLMLGSYYRDEDNAVVYEVVDGKLVYQSVLPHGNPVIFLPAGTLRALLTAP